MPQNKRTVAKALEGYKVYIADCTESQLKKYCWSLLDKAIKSRQQAPGAHNFTGNFLNSIVVCLYREGNPVIAYYSSSLVPEAIVPKMRKRIRRRVFFSKDYDGEQSAYLPTVDTNGGWGKDDAQKFFEYYKPSGNNLFDIVVAYTVEYADWINYERGTAGFLNTLQCAENIARTFLEIH